MMIRWGEGFEGPCLLCLLVCTGKSVIRSATASFCRSPSRGAVDCSLSRASCDEREAWALVESRQREGRSSSLFFSLSSLIGLRLARSLLLGVLFYLILGPFVSFFIKTFYFWDKQTHTPGDFWRELTRYLDSSASGTSHFKFQIMGLPFISKPIIIPSSSNMGTLSLICI